MALRPPAAGTLLPSQAFGVEVAGQSVLRWQRLLQAKVSGKPLELSHARSFPRLLMMLRAPEPLQFATFPRIGMVDDLTYCLHSMVLGKSPRQANGYLQGLTNWSKHPIQLSLVRQCALATGDLDTVLKVDTTMKAMRVDYSRIRRESVVCEMKCWDAIRRVQHDLSRGVSDPFAQLKVESHLKRLLRSGQVRSSRSLLRLWLLLETAASIQLAAEVLSRRREFFLENRERREPWRTKQLILYDLETVHDSPAVFGDREDLRWLDRTRVIQLAARNFFTALSSSAQKFCKVSEYGMKPFGVELPLFPEAWRETVVPFLRDQARRGPLVMAAFNGKLFDHRVLSQYHLPGWRLMRKIDPLIAARRVGRPGSFPNGFSLSSLYHYKVGGWAPGAHTAQGDVDMLVDLIREWPELTEAVMEDFKSVDRKRRVRRKRSPAGFPQEYI
ncbi:hypothetical protein FOZ60_008753 [Perkinsus olseni]|uniref:Uncharacterized protein n=1 Tax=Perkinsus olseni TaxID=32597 RepID=A0A7J6NKS9_PEROL|nr:hypothetical protein FOZ60_008753 [Perkinsus olseni]